jgi:hypothetical protein
MEGLSKGGCPTVGKVWWGTSGASYVDDKEDVS